MFRSLEMWLAFMERTSKKNISDYLIIGDMINENLIDYIRANMQLETNIQNYIQTREIQGYYFDLSRALRPVYHTFSSCNNKWRYHGICYKWEMINRY